MNPDYVILFAMFVALCLLFGPWFILALVIIFGVIALIVYLTYLYFWFVCVAVFVILLVMFMATLAGRGS